MKKVLKAVVLCLALALCCTLAGCGNDSAKIEPQTVKIAALAGPTGMGMAQMIDENPSLGDGVTAEYHVATAPDQIMGDVINGTYQIAALPTNTAAALYNKTDGKIVLGAVNTLGTLSIITTQDAGVSSIADLRGKTIVATGQGATPQYILENLLKKAGLTPGTDVTVEYLGDHAEAAARLASGEATIALLPQPFATVAMTKNPSLVQAVDISKAWEAAYDGKKLEMGCIVVNKEWADNNKALLSNFMNAYESSIAYVNKDDDASAQAVVKAGILQNEALAKKAIPNCAIVFIPAQDAKDDLNAFYKILADSNAQSVGGKVPATDSAFYSLEY